MRARFSITSTFAPASAAERAADEPAGPAPTTRTSTQSYSAVLDGMLQFQKIGVKSMRVKPEIRSTKHETNSKFKNRNDQNKLNDPFHLNSLLSTSRLPVHHEIVSSPVSGAGP